MTSSTIIRIVDTARINLVGAMDGVIFNELFNVVKDFTQQSNCWRDIVPLDVTPFQDNYVLETATQGYINRLLWLEGPRMAGNTPGTYHAGAQKEGHLLETGAQSAVISVRSIPQAAERWYAHVALTVCDPTDKDAIPVFPEWLLEKYQKYIVSGVISVMAAHAAKPYSSIKLAEYHGRLFRAGVALARNEAEHGYTHRGQRWTFPQTFRSTTQKAFGRR